ncbi:hypothetical protein A11A3_03964 [Alcanivorax hongdengensis A-11-3]|uniref:Peptidase M20 dimerisation domain-containing protein n=1 Tax=Alcanivorax hongdengensis A-11-3 TaxID=1177179 RepID=L0WF72_9GAMM|nr:M20/M25/M40 family metallo-hydrolase [Alcanivorax hongdengensis]EKF75483.1 hypothetical protein A11A3_03964 [Alcanivorax hongdengensis A-11-3]
MKRALILAALALLVLVAVLVVRTLRVTAPDYPAVTPPALALDSDALARRLAAALRFPTTADNPAAFKAFHGFLADSFPRTWQTLSPRFFGNSVLLHWRSGHDCAPTLLLAHQDVVPVSEPDQWQQPAFAGVLDDDFVWGRGALDDKGSLMGILEASEALLAAGQTPPCDIYLALGADEEIGGNQGAARIAAALKKQGLHFAMVLDEGGMVLPGAMLGIRQSVAVVGIAEKGYVTMKLVAHGEAGHSSRPPAHTAVGDLAAAVADLQAYPRPAHLSGPTWQMLESIAPYQGFGKRLVLSNLWLFKSLVRRQLEGKPATNALVRTTSAPTVFKAGVKDNVIPAQASALVNFRLAPGDDVDTLLADLKRRLPATIDVSIYQDFRSNPSAVSAVPSPQWQRLAGLIRTTLKVEDASPVVAPYLLVAGTDSRHYQGLSEQIFRFMPVRLGQQDLHRFHGRDERLARDQLATMVRFYAGVMMAPAGG